MSLFEIMKNYKNEHNRVKYIALEELQMTTEYSTPHYDILKQNANSTAMEVRAILQRQPVEVITILGSEPINEGDEACLARFMISMTAYLDTIQHELMNQKAMYKLYSEQLANTDIDHNNILASMTNRGLISAVRSVVKTSITNLNALRTGFKDSYKQEIRYLFKCIFHTWKSKAMDNLLELNVVDFLDFCCRQYVLDKALLEHLYTIMLDLEDVSNTTYSNMYDMMITMNSIECINTDHIFDIIISSYKEFKASPIDDSAVTTILNLLHSLDVVTDSHPLNLEQFGSDDLIRVILIIMDMYKYMNSNKLKVFEVIFSPISIMCSIMVKIMEIEEFVLYSFLIYYIPYTMLTSPPHITEICPSFINVFKMLSSRNKFFQYIGSFMTSNMRPILECVFDGDKKAIKKIDMKSGMYETAGEMDSDSTFRDELTGCMIVSPSLLKVGERDIWVDGYAFLSYLYQKPENPYTRESLTPEEFLDMQKGHKEQIRQYKKDRKEFLMKVLEDE